MTPVQSIVLSVASFVLPYLIAIILSLFKKTSADVISLLICLIGLPLTLPAIIVVLVKMVKRYPERIEKKENEKNEETHTVFYDELKDVSFLVFCDLAAEHMDKNRGANYHEILRKRDTCDPLILALDDGEMHLAPLAVMPGEDYTFAVAMLIRNGAMDQKSLFFVAATEANPFQLTLLDTRDELYIPLCQDLKRIFLELLDEADQPASSEESCEDVSLSDILYSDSREPIFLDNGDGKKLGFEQIFVLPHKGNTYCILKPMQEMDNVGDNEAIVFRLQIDDDGFETLAVETDEEMIKLVFDAYYAALDEAEDTE